MPVDEESCFFFLVRFRKTHLRAFSRKDGFAVYCETFFKYPQFFEPWREFEGDKVLIGLGVQLDFDLKPHGDISAPTSEILRFNKSIHPIHSLRDYLKDAEGAAD